MISLEAILGALPALAFILGLAYLFIRQRRAAKGDPAAALEEQRSVEALIESVLFQYVTDAERNYGSNTGRLKLSAVVGWIVDFLPDKYKTVFSVDQLADKAENALRAAKEFWKQNPSLLGASDTPLANAVGFAMPEE